MSRTMQLTVETRPHYPKSFVASYPRLARHLEAVTPGLVGPEPTLLELASRTDELIGELSETALGRLLEARAPELRRAAATVEERNAEWQLAEADQILYQIEDIFDALEAELGKR